MLGVCLLLAISIAAVGAVIDMRTGHIPNWLTLGSLCLAPPVVGVLTASTHGVRSGLLAAGLSLLGAVVCGLPPFVAFVRKGMGGGDVKLLAAIGALLGPRVGLDAEFYAFLIGALYVPAKLAWNGTLLSTLAGLMRAAMNPLRSKEVRADVPAALKLRIRLGPAICAGTMTAAALGWLTRTGA